MKNTFIKYFSTYLHYIDRNFEYKIPRIAYKEDGKKRYLNFEPVFKLYIVFSRRGRQSSRSTDCERNPGNALISLSFPVFAVVKSRPFLRTEVVLIHSHLQTGSL